MMNAQQTQLNNFLLIFLMLVGLILVLSGIFHRPLGLPDDQAVYGIPAFIFLIIMGCFLMLIAALLILGIRPTRVAFGKNVFELSQVSTYTETTSLLSKEVVQKTLKKDELEERALYARSKSLPDIEDKEYSAIQLTKVNRLLVIPSGQAMAPMYILDKDYRILDWNEAFSLAFDRTMEGRQGQSILEWTYLLDNYQEVLDHGEKVFSNPDKLPLIDIETIEYTSLRYGPITAVKRAFQIPDDDGNCFAWLITLQMDFTNPNEKTRFKYELLRLNGLQQLWSEYAISYDRVLTNTRVYRDLIDSLLGIKNSPLPPIAATAKVLDLGAGTGNIALRLMTGNSRRTVFAVDKNRVMLEFLRDKCENLLLEDDNKPGVLAIKQDVTTLYGLPENYFDCVVANNVFYALPDPETCLESILKVLKPGGELRMSGPRHDTDLKILFERIRNDLITAGKFDEYQADYDHVEQINMMRLDTMLHKWSTNEFCELLTKKGYAITHSSDDVYADQSMLVAAIKPFTDETSPKFTID